MAIGFRGGQELNQTGLGGDGLKVVGASLLLEVAIPALLYPVLSRRINLFDAAAIAATYGSVSTVTFVTASQFLVGQGNETVGYLTVAPVVMKSRQSSWRFCLPGGRSVELQQGMALHLMTIRSRH